MLCFNGITKMLGGDCIFDLDECFFAHKPIRDYTY